MYSEAAMQFSRTIKGLFILTLRQAMGMTRSLLKLVGWLVWACKYPISAPSAV